MPEVAPGLGLDDWLWVGAVVGTFVLVAIDYFFGKN